MFGRAIIIVVLLVVAAWVLGGTASLWGENVDSAGAGAQALARAGDSMMIGEIAAQERIPRKFLEQILLDVMFDVPSRGDVKKCIVSAETVNNRVAPLLLTAAGTAVHLGEDDRPATELTLQAWCGGIIGLGRGAPDRPPVQVGGQVGEWLTGVYAAVGTLRFGDDVVAMTRAAGATR